MTYPIVYPHRKEDYITKLAPVNYMAGAKCPRFEKFLMETFDGDPGLMGYLTGQDELTAQLKYQNFFSFKSQCKLVLVTNHPPHVPAGDDALAATPRRAFPAHRAGQGRRQRNFALGPDA